MSRGHYRDGAELQDTEHSWVHSAFVLAIGVGLGWLWFGLEAKRQRRAMKSGPDVSDIEAAIRARGRNPRTYGLSGR